MDKLPFQDGQSPYGGVPRGQEGRILQRGGAELRLKKRHDRFVVHPQNPQDQEWRSLLPSEQVQPIPGFPLWEVLLDSGTPGTSPDLDTLMDHLRSHPQVLYVGHGYSLGGVAARNEHYQSWVYLGDDITLMVAPTVTRERLKQLTNGVGLALGRAIPGLPHTYLTQVTPLARENPIKLANRLQRFPEVLAAEANVIIPQRHHYHPQDTLYPQQWYLHHGGGEQLLNGCHLDMEAAWDITRGDRSVVIAVMDDGLDLSHPDFQGMGKIVAPRDLRDQDFVPLPLGNSDNHGTAVAGLALAEENGHGIVGVAPGCALMPIRTTGYLDDRTMETAFDWAVSQGAAVICCSWGAAAVEFPLSLRQQAAITRATTQGRQGKGCVVVFAAGNFNRPINGSLVERHWPEGLLQGKTQWLNGFAAHPDVIVVSACTSLGRKAAYSNWGKEVFISAPSNSDIPRISLGNQGVMPTAPGLKTVPPGLGLLTTDRLGEAGYTTGDFTGSFGGTSSAAPLVAGVVGLMLSANPQLTVADVKTILRQTADRLVDPRPDPQLGLRLGSYNNQGHSPWFGYGKVNGAKAVTQALAQGFVWPAVAPEEVAKFSLFLATPLPIPDNDRLVQPLTVNGSVPFSVRGCTRRFPITIAWDGAVNLDCGAPGIKPWGPRGS